MIRKAEEIDIDNIIQLHLKTFRKNHFSALFSKRMLRRYFQLLLSLNKYNFVLYADNNTLLGYIIAGYKSRDAVNIFTKEYILQLIYILLRNPKFISEKVNELLTKNRKTRDEKRSKCRLYLIGVNNNFKGKGIARSLVNNLEIELKKNEINIYGLSVRKDNVEAIRFYNKSGYSIEHEDAKSIYYSKEI